ncbi:MAG: heliorhodopsin HeR [Candidatus Kerfeldbacteria bacterium]|nr:heliorhodopsin HeR [Candidatus Kerfeldbacteria bacterium]
MPNTKTFRNLRRWNIVMFFLHAIQAMAVLVLSNSFAVPLTTAFLNFNTRTFTLQQHLQQLTTIPVGPLVAGFFALSALAHLLVSLPGIYEWYVKNLKKGANYARWVEYSLSSSLMIVVIGMLVGIYDVFSLLLMFGLNAMMILFGWMMELHNQSTKKTNWTAYIFGCIAGAIPWIVIACYLVFSGDADHHAPTFVYWIFFSMFLFFNSFAVNMVLQYKKVGKWKDYTYGEKVYIIMSLVAKSLLAWQVFAGTLRPV